MREEFEALGYDYFDRRGAVMDEQIQLMKAMWTEDLASYDGEFFHLPAVGSQPHPLQRPHPPIWIGGHSRPALRRAAKYGDGWHPVGANPAVPLRPHELQAALDDLKRLIAAEGRDADAMTITFKAPLYDVSPSGEMERAPGLERRPFSGTTAQVAEDIHTYGRLGVSELIFDFRRESLSESLDRMEHFATVIKPAAGD
jgi:alkanesulfonate monooxygenase SsuD/methylene tetrahydromethanopterin reductase-like flavin-dependent oxidoreductase (luciferase family)